MFRSKIITAAVVITLGIVVGGCAFKNDPPREISAINRIEIGGLSQAYRERGVSSDLPLLLFLHGGPGVPDMPLARITAELEKDFIVIHWDQRGAGKTFNPTNPPGGMNVNQFANDALELTDHLLTKHNRKKLHLVGFSFGSLVGMEIVHRRPEKFITYTSIAQFVDIPASEIILKQEALARAQQAGDTRALQTLRKFGPTGDDTHKQEAIINKVAENLVSENVANPFGMWDYLGTALFSGIYTPYEVGKTIIGRRYSGESLAEELYDIDLRKTVRRIEVPSTFLLARWDTLLSANLAKDYIDALSAPSGKRIIWFEKSGHSMHLEQPQKFIGIMQDIARSHKLTGN